MCRHVHKFDSGFGLTHTVLQGIQFYLLKCECGAIKGFPGAIVRPNEAAAYGHSDEELSER